jgi:AraC-like DNA-binding protein
MALIAALIPNPARLFRLRSAIRGRHGIEPCTSWEQVLELCETRPVHLAIVDLFATLPMTLDPIRQLKRRFPRMSTVAYVDVTSERGRDLFDAGRSGVDALIIANVDDDALNIAAIIERAEARGVAGILRTMLEELRPIARDALLLSVTRAHETINPEDLARRLSLSRRVLAKHLEHAGLPSPQRLITWGRLLVAAHLLEDPERSADNIALALHFPSGSAFRNTCQRYVHATPSEIRKNGGAPWVLTQLQSHDHSADRDDEQLDGDSGERGEGEAA